MTPWLVTPGPWSDKDLEHHTRQLAEGEGGRPLRRAAQAAGSCAPQTSPCPISINPNHHPPSLLSPPSCVAPNSLASNCSCNCLAPKVILLAADWPQADAFVAGFKAELAKRACTPRPTTPACASGTTRSSSSTRR